MTASNRSATDLELIAEALPASSPDLAFALTLVNAGTVARVQCTKELPFGSALGLHGFDANLAFGNELIATRRAFNPAWGPPAPPNLGHYLKEVAQKLAPGAKRTTRVVASWLAARRLLVFEAIAAELDPTDPFYGRAVIEVPGPGSHQLIFTYVEDAGYGFEPPNPVSIRAAPLTIVLP